MNKISLILIIFVLLSMFSLIINKKTRNITISSETKNIISMMFEVLEKNFTILTMFMSLITISQEISDDSVYETYKNEADCFFETNEESFVEYRKLETKLLYIIHEAKLNEKEYSKIVNACSAGAFCFDEMREMFITMSAYFLFKDEKRINTAIAIAAEIYTAHQTSQYLRKFL